MTDHDNDPLRAYFDRERDQVEPLPADDERWGEITRRAGRRSRRVWVPAASVAAAALLVGAAVTTGIRQQPLPPATSDSVTMSVQTPVSTDQPAPTVTTVPTVTTMPPVTTVPESPPASTTRRPAISSTVPPMPPATSSRSAAPPPAPGSPTTTTPRRTSTAPPPPPASTSVRTPPTTRTSPTTTGCDATAITNDTGRVGITVDVCVGDWALVSTPGPGDTSEFVHRSSGHWTVFDGQPSTRCQSEAKAEGVPKQLLPYFRACSTTPSAADGRGETALLS
ncbi:hypothetical protein [Humibacillus sp. DSM 29435]|uniref:hypothetical protein n=1 Tax=Humibacillus sp. DSM 29435 TaxID=1869167 RepID=UPI001586F7BA|nr:hypothetical protein [Humibacillus sp. DSM 29435]